MPFFYYYINFLNSQHSRRTDKFTGLFCAETPFLKAGFNQICNGKFNKYVLKAPPIQHKF